MRGQVYTIQSKKFFTFGGAVSTDKESRTIGVSWWEREMPSFREMDDGLTNLEKHAWSVDYIITHDCSIETYWKLGKYLELYARTNNLNSYFDNIEAMTDFKYWLFGHYHIDAKIDEKHVALYQQIHALV